MKIKNENKKKTKSTSCDLDIVLNKRLQFVAEITKELNGILGIEMKLLTAFYLQTDGQTKRMNQNST